VIVSFPAPGFDSRRREELGQTRLNTAGLKLDYLLRVNQRKGKRFAPVVMPELKLRPPKQASICGAVVF